MSLFRSQKDDDLDLFTAHLSSLTPEEGQLSVDVYQLGDKLVIKSTIAGARPEDIEVLLADDAITIKGRREMDEYVDYKDYLNRECYWGKFTRTLILPFAVNEKTVTVDLERGVLTVTLTKAEKSPPLKIQPKHHHD